MMPRRGGRATQRTENRIMSLFDPASWLGRGAGALLALAVATGCSTYNPKYLVLRRPRFRSTRHAAGRSSAGGGQASRESGAFAATGARRWKRDSFWLIS
jgi:hypothetical protein